MIIGLNGCIGGFSLSFSSCPILMGVLLFALWWRFVIIGDYPVPLEKIPLVMKRLAGVNG